MQRCDILPAEFNSIASQVHYVVKRTHNEWSSECPRCGGSVHKNGDLPDRFRMWKVSKYGKPLGWCRSCGYIWTPESDRKPTREEIEQWRLEQIKIEQERKQAAERALELLQNNRLWEQFYSQNNDWSRQIYRERGISDSWIDYLKLGLMPDYVVRGDGEYHSPASTIPVWNVGGVVQNIKLRILNPKCNQDRYRNFYQMGNSFLFVPLYDLPLTGAGIIVEGEFKSIVLEQTLNDPKYRVVGVQSKSPDPEIFEQLKGLDPIYIWLDPDAFRIECDLEGKSRETAVERMVRLVGKERSLIVKCPCKVDDGIVEKQMEPKKFLSMAKRA